MNYVNDEEILIDVKVIRSKGQVTLIEWDDAGRFRRILVPREVVFESKNGRGLVTEESLEMGMPYGVNWEARLQKSFIITGAKIAEQLEVAGIWTKEDYEQNPSVAQQAVLGAAKVILIELYAIIRNIPKQEN
ncbi:hypothetical protein LCGC14_1765620 [marine sediment metagenome]|uniref:Uncharacterized protein n=1 Tax=marine sediment metagenome TaxID=412755 RepID=A0A0F9JEQ6_9ZZZZ